MTFREMIKRPSAFLPLTMSGAALGTVLVHLALFGIVRQADEGAAARTFQLLIGLQVPLVAFFAIRYVPREPRAALRVLALQVFAGIVALAPVFVLGL